VFWKNLDVVINAVDNVHARRYIDDQCCYYQKPLFESGTLGTKCNSQLILPNQTQSYSESQDPPEESIPLCTLKNFPYQIEHTIQWARDYFQGVFADGSIECIKYLENPNDYLKKTNAELRTQPGVLRPRLENVKRYVSAATNPTYTKCVELARNMF
jgi:ubiquitin-activating enzyme E1